MTAGLREVGALGLAGPRTRLSGLARAVVAQLAALHSPESLEIVLLSTDRSRTAQERTAEWSWLGWLPHLRPGHGQDCRLLVAYDREQATARTDELLRRLEDHYAETATKIPVSSASPASSDTAEGAARRPSWARDDDPAESADGFAGPYTVVVVDGDPGGAAVREAVARLAHEGPRAGHTCRLPRGDGVGVARVAGDRDVRGGLRGLSDVPRVRGGGAARRRRGHGPACDAGGAGGGDRTFADGLQGHRCPGLRRLRRRDGF